VRSENDAGYEWICVRSFWNSCAGLINSQEKPAGQKCGDVASYRQHRKNRPPRDGDEQRDDFVREPTNGILCPEKAAQQYARRRSINAQFHPYGRGGGDQVGAIDVVIALATKHRNIITHRALGIVSSRYSFSGRPLAGHAVNPLAIGEQRIRLRRPASGRWQRHAYAFPRPVTG
jgi:hypothetical protein